LDEPQRLPVLAARDYDERLGGIWRVRPLQGAAVDLRRGNRGHSRPSTRTPRRRSPPHRCRHAHPLQLRASSGVQEGGGILTAVYGPSRAFLVRSVSCVVLTQHLGPRGFKFGRDSSPWSATPYVMRQTKSHNPRLWRDIPWELGTRTGFLAQDGRMCKR
jgi:hypothetical protein